MSRSVSSRTCQCQLLSATHCIVTSENPINQPSSVSFYDRDIERHIGTGSEGEEEVGERGGK